jgi:hypothetical protein
MSIITESVPKPGSIRRRIEQLRKALADLEYLLPVAERVHTADDHESASPSKSRKGGERHASR